MVIKRIKEFGIFMLLTVLLISDTACSQNSWTKIKYTYDAGSLPPPYKYNYTLTVSNDGNAELVYKTGYSGNERSTFSYNVEINNYMFKTLQNEIRESKVLNQRIEQMPSSEIPDGGHSDYLQIYNGDELISSVPSYPDSKYKESLDKIYKALFKCIPDEIWKEIESKQSEIIGN